MVLKYSTNFSSTILNNLILSVEWVYRIHSNDYVKYLGNIIYQLL